MNFKKGILYGLLIWVIMFAVSSAFLAFGLVNGSTSMNVGMWFAVAIVTYIITGYLHIGSSKKAFQYGLLWAIVGIILDYFITTHFAPGIFSSSAYWMSYLLIVLVPMIRARR